LERNINDTISNIKRQLNEQVPLNFIQSNTNPTHQSNLNHDVAAAQPPYFEQNAEIKSNQLILTINTG
jgi:hypothetical protein